MSSKKSSFLDCEWERRGEKSWHSQVLDRGRQVSHLEIHGLKWLTRLAQVSLESGGTGTFKRSRASSPVETSGVTKGCKIMKRAFFHCPSVSVFLPSSHLNKADDDCFFCIFSEFRKLRPRWEENEIEFLSTNERTSLTASPREPVLALANVRRHAFAPVHAARNSAEEIRSTNRIFAFLAGKARRTSAIKSMLRSCRSQTDSAVQTFLRANIWRDEKSEKTDKKETWYFWKQDGKAVIMAEAWMATLTDLTVTDQNAINTPMPTIQLNSFLILFW